MAVPSSNASGTISLNLSYDGAFDGTGFTITAYSGLGMRWAEPLRALPFDHRISGTLTTKTSGGNYTLPTFMINPQYRLHVPTTTQDGPSGKTRVEVSLHAPRDVPINVVITWGRGERVFEWVYPHIRVRIGFLRTGQLNAERYHSDIRRLYLWVHPTFRRSPSYVTSSAILHDQVFRTCLY